MKPTNYYFGIDIIRFFAAISVVSFHFGYLNSEADFTAVWPITWFGWVGVEIFFVISGFVIANSANGASPTQFLRGRVLRLYPAAWFCATVTLLVRTQDDVLSSYLRSMVLLPKGPWISTVYWTLAIEIVFYGLIFLLLCLQRFSQLNRVALVLTICSSVHLFGFKIWEVSDHLNILLLRHGCFFALGIWLWLSTKRQLLAWEYIVAMVSIVACVVEIWIRGSQYLPGQFDPISVLAPTLVWSAAIFCVWLSSRAYAPVHPRIASFTRVIGLMTYPLYLVHHELGHRIIVDMILRGAGKWTAVMIATLSVVLLSWIVCIFWEPQIRRALSFLVALGARHRRGTVA